MRVIGMALGLVLALLVQPAQASERPEHGAYMLVNTVLDGVAAGEIVPIVTHMTLDGGHMEFTFITGFSGDAQMCATLQKCRRAVNALALDFTETDDGWIAVRDFEIRTGEGMTIDRPGVDADHIIWPMIAMIDGARVTWSDDAVVFVQPDGRTARFLAGDLDTALDALAFALMFEESLARLDHCVIRQVMEIANTSVFSRTAAEREILRVARFAGLFMRVDDANSYWSSDPDNDPRDPAEAEATLHRQVILSAALAFVRYEEGEVAAEAIEEGISALSEFFADYEAIRRELILPHLDEIAAARRYTARYQQVLAEGHDPIQALCTSLHLDL